MAELPENIGTGKIGRPTSEKEIAINESIREYFLQGASPAFVIQKTGLSKNTVYSKYKELAEKVESEDNQDFLKRYEERRQQHQMVLDNLSTKEFKMLDRIEDKIEQSSKDNKIPPYLLQVFSTTIKNLLFIEKERDNSNHKPTLQEKLKKIVKEEMEDENDK